MSRKFLDSAYDYTPADSESRQGIMGLFPPPDEPKSELEIYRLLGPKAGVRVSPICLGVMNLGNQWTAFFGGATDREHDGKFLDTFCELGGNFIDTSSNYQDEQNEMIVGEWMEKRGIRDEMVISTKYTSSSVDRKEGRFPGHSINYTGNHKKNMRLSLEASLKKLRTTYVDVLYIHWWDYTCSVEEIMNALNDLVREGKVLYLGISAAPAWIVAEANAYAKHHGLTGFCIYQGNWNLTMRDMERDIIPMCKANGITIAPFGVLGSGKFKTPDELKVRAATMRAGIEVTDADLKIAAVLQEVASELGDDVSLAAVGMAWARQVCGGCIPVMGGANIEHLKANVAALKLKLTDVQIEKLSNANPFDWGFPYGFGRDPHYLPEGKPNGFALTSAGHLRVTQLP